MAALRLPLISGLELCGLGLIVGIVRRRKMMKLSLFSGFVFGSVIFSKRVMSEIDNGYFF